MFEIAELGQTMSKEEYQASVPDLRIKLVELQHRLKSADFSVVIVLSGFETAGRSEVLQTLHEWMDPRFLMVHTYGKPSDEEAERPYFWRFWRAMPPNGRIGVYFGSWYTQPFLRRFKGKIDDDALDAAMRHITTFEKELADDGTLILKFWLHLSKDAQKDRVRDLKKSKQWRIQPIDKILVKRYGEFRQIAERVLRLTDSAAAPWTIIDGSDPRHRAVSVATQVASVLSARLDGNGIAAAPAREPVQRVSQLPQVSVLNSLDLSQSLEKEEYEKQLADCQGRLFDLTREANRQGVNTILVFEGWDAAGKGGIVRRLAAGMDPRTYSIIPIGAPTQEEKAHHYLWRFWRHLPRAGRMLIFDRSWYGRVLVERVEGFASALEWQRAYQEINDFEQQMCEHSYILLKFWLHIDKDEQYKRFKKRESTPYKRFKITADDWRNREKWDDYDGAVNEMVARCSTGFAPWHLVEANDKRFARVKVLKTVCTSLEKRLE